MARKPARNSSRLQFPCRCGAVAGQRCLSKPAKDPGSYRRPLKHSHSYRGTADVSDAGPSLHDDDGTE